MEVDLSNNQELLDNFVLENSPTDSYRFFKLSKWGTLISDYYGFKCFNLVVKDKNTIIAYFPLFLVKSRLFGNHFIAVPFTGHGGDVVVQKESEVNECLKIIFKKIKDLANENNVKYLQIRGPKEENMGFFLSNGCKEPLKDFNFFLDLSVGTIDDFKKRIDKKLRNIIKSSEKKQVKVFEDNTSCGLAKFYEIYSRTMKRLGSPPLSKRFLRDLLNSGNLKIYIAEYDLKVVSSSIFLVKENYATWYLGANDDKHNSLNANSLILWTFIKDNFGRITHFDLGTSRETSSNYDYKKKWNPKIVRASKLYYYFNDKKEVIDIRNKKYSLFSFIWRYLMPNFLAKYIGPQIRKGMGS
jgi:lipid II:glycine glycyltransferase (peptidoglycan interpeptide bridge formation enzyme)